MHWSDIEHAQPRLASLAQANALFYEKELASCQ